MENKYSESTSSFSSASSQSNHSGALSGFLYTYRRYGKFIKYLQFAAVLSLIILVLSIYKTIVNGNATIKESETIEGIAVRNDTTVLMIKVKNNGYLFLMSGDSSLSYNMIDTLIQDENKSIDFLNGFRVDSLLEPKELFDNTINEEIDSVSFEPAAAAAR